MRLVRNTFWMAVATGAVSLATFLSQTFLLKWLPKEAYDGIVLLLSTTSVFTLLSHLGIPLAATKLIARHWGRSDDEVPVGQVVGASLGLTLTTSLIFMVALGVGGYGVYRLYPLGPWGVWLALTPLWLLSSAALRIGTGITNGFQRMGWSAILLMMREVPRAAALPIIWLLVPTLNSVVLVYSAIAAGGLLAAVVILRSFLRHMDVRPVAPTQKVLGLVAHEGLPLYIPYIVSEVSIPLLTLIVGAFSSESGVVGSFRWYAAASALVMLPLVPLIATALPKLASADLRETRTLSSRVFGLTSLYAVAMMTFFLYGGTWLLNLVTREQITAPIHLLYLLVLARVAVSVALVPDALLRSQHTARANAILETVRFTATLVLGFVLTWRFGAAGAAGAYALCMIGGTVAQVVLVRTMLGIRLWRETIGSALPLAVLGAGFTLGWGEVWTIALTATAAVVLNLGIFAKHKTRSPTDADA